MNLSILQGYIKKDPVSFREDFILQYKNFESELSLLKLKPTKDTDRIEELLDFISHTCVHFKDDAQSFFQNVANFLENHVSVIEPTIRVKMYNALTVLSRKMKLDKLLLIKLSFKLLNIQDKNFRETIMKYLYGIIKTVSSDTKVKQSIQSFVHSFIVEEDGIVSQKTIEILAELYRKKIWIDAKTVNIIASACYNKDNKVALSSMKFFLGIDIEVQEEENKPKLTLDDIDLHEHSKKTKKRKRQVLKDKKKIVKQNQNQDTQAVPIFPAIMMINNPHDLAEYSFKKIAKIGDKFENKLIVMNFVSRLIGCHKLLILNFYSHIQKYLTSHQNNVTNILVYLVQACHDQIPPQDLMPVLKSIAHNLITDRSPEESIALGLNTTKEIFARNPSILHEDEIKDLVADLVLYGQKTKKCVTAAARSLINFLRKTYPKLLPKNHRGKDCDLKAVPRVFGQEHLVTELSDDKEEGSEDEDEWEEMEEDDEENEEVDEDEEGWEDMEEDEGVEGEEDEDGWEEVDSEEEENDDEEDDDEDQEEDDDEDQEEENDEEEEEEEEEVKNFSNENSDESDSDNSDNEAFLPDYVVDPSSLLSDYKAAKTTKIERIKRVLEGRTEKRFEGGHRGGLTNKEKMRKKNFMMVRKGKRSVLNKIRRSTSEVRTSKAKQKEIYGRDKRKRRRT